MINRVAAETRPSEHFCDDERPRACAIVGCSLWPDDPLMAAMIWKLPRKGERFDATAREKWLAMMAMAFDVAYGESDAALPAAAAREPATELEPPAAAPPPHVQYGCDFYVDTAGVARCDYERADGGPPAPSPGRRVLADEAAGSEIYDYRGAARDRSTVRWADDTVGAVPGMNFCGPG